MANARPISWANDLSQLGIFYIFKLVVTFWLLIIIERCLSLLLAACGC